MEFLNWLIFNATEAGRLVRDTLHITFWTRKRIYKSESNANLAYCVMTVLHTEKRSELIKYEVSIGYRRGVTFR